MLRQQYHGFDGNIDARSLRPVVNQQRDFALVGHRAEIQDLGRGVVQQIFVIVRRADHGRFVAALGCRVGEGDGFTHALHAGAGQQDFIGRRVFGHPFP